MTPLVRNVASKGEGLPFSLTEQVLFAKQLSFLLGAGVPLLESIQILKNKAPSKKTQRLFTIVEHDVADGLFLSTSLRHFKNAFDPCVVELIRIGELSGTLTKNLAYLSEELRKKHLLRRKMQGALLYPSIVTLATLGMVSMLTFFIFPKIMPIFIGMKIPLPWTTRTLLTLSTFLRDYGLITTVALLCAGIFSLWSYKNLPFIQEQVDRLVLALPLVGTMTRTYHTATFCRTSYSLLESGIMLPEVLTILAETTRNAVYKQTYITLAQNIRRGKTLSSEIYTTRRYFDTTLHHMIAIGEQSGKLSETFKYLSETYEADIDELTKNLSNTIEPALMIMMGLLVGFVALSVITPIYEITQHLNRR